jgi:hypothetical protein
VAGVGDPLNWGALGCRVRSSYEGTFSTPLFLTRISGPNLVRWSTTFSQDGDTINAGRDLQIRRFNPRGPDTVPTHGVEVNASAALDLRW